MNKKLPLIIGALVILGIIAFLLMPKGQNNPPQQTTQPAQTQATQQPSAEPKSLKDLLSLGKAQSCTFSDSSNNQTTVFIANNKMRGDFVAESEGKTMKTHIIVDGQTSYIWIDGQTTGYKMSVDKAAQNQAQTQQNQIDLDKQANYTCKDWTADSSLFNLPLGINFTDLSKLVAPAASGSSSAQCAACESLEGAAKTQCKTALKCN